MFHHGSSHHWHIRSEYRVFYRVLGLALETLATMMLIYLLVVLVLVL